MKVNLSRRDSKGTFSSSIYSIKILLSGLISFLILDFSSGDEFLYKFDNPQDEVTCKNIAMQKITKFRRVSITPLKWESANECCKRMGMNLHTPETGDEDLQLNHVLTNDPSSGLGEPTDYWTSGTSINGKSKWQNGSDVNKVLGKKVYPRERYSWAADENKKPNPTKQCISVIPTKQGPNIGFLSMKNMDCKSELPFICQTEPQLGGKDLVQSEIELCKDLNLYEEIAPGFIVGLEKVRWPVAKFCCELQGWSLIANVKAHEDVIVDGLYRYLDDAEAVTDVAFWSSLNDICKYRDFNWICGTRDNILWRTIPEENITNPDDYGYHENCGEHYWNGFFDPHLYVNDLNCDLLKYFVCEEKPPCAKDKQWPCSGKAPRKVYPYDEIEEDMKTCNSIRYSVFGTSPHYTYYISSKKLTWGGAMRCLQNQSLDLASFQTDQDIEFFNKTLFFTPEYSDFPLQFWNNATSWKHKGSDLKWPDESPLNPAHRINLTTHDKITPICGKTTMYENKVGIMTENCLNKLKFVYKVLQENPPDNHTDDNKVTVDNNGSTYFVLVPNEPDPFLEFKFNQTKSENFCPARDTMKLERMVCNSSATSIFRPTGNDTHLKKMKLTEKDLFKLELQNEKLKQMVLDFGLAPYIYKRHAPIYGFKLLSLSASTYAVLCPDVPFNFIYNGFRYFHDLHWLTSQGRTELLEKSEYNSINKMLRTCWNNSLTGGLRFRVDSCGEWTFSIDKCTNFICPARAYQFNIKEADPLVEMMWKVYELVHSACFKYFDTNYRMFHKYAQAIMDLWSDEIRLRWRNQIETNKFWERILGPAYELHLLNMDKCNEAIIQRNLNVRLSRNTLPARVRLHGSE